MAKTFFEIHRRWFWDYGGHKKDVEYWINQFNGLRKTIKIDKWSFGNHIEYMEICIQRRKSFSSGFLDFKIFQNEINRYTYIPQKSGHIAHTIKNYVLGELKRYIRFNSLKLSFLKIRTTQRTCCWEY